MKTDLTTTTRSLVVLLALAVLAGCSTTRTLMPTPHLYSEGHEVLFEDLAPELQSSKVPVFYVTDRAPETDEAGQLKYGFQRSASIGYGEATVEIGEGVTWQEVVAASRSRKREQRLGIELRQVRELGRTPSTPYPIVPRGGFFDYTPTSLEQGRVALEKFRQQIDARLALTPRKEVLLFVHGYNNSFRDAALTWAGMWHFFGREGVPVLYTWPAGHGGLLGYAVDRESGEFTIHHLKMLLKALSEFPEVEGLRIFAHSRGTDVLVTALRELFAESRAAGVDPRERFRIRHLMLAAPDLDLGVMEQRVMTEPIGIAVGAITIYVSPTDKALGISRWLFGGLRRLGTAEATSLDRSTYARLKTVGNVNFVELKGDGGSFGHSYFHENPAVSSDVLLAIRFDRKPGAEHGRPLEPQGNHFWLIRDGYLLPPP